MRRPLLAAALLAASTAALAQNPPFWARPKAPAAADCPPAAVQPESSSSLLKYLLLGGVALALLGRLAVLQLRRSAERAEASRRAALQARLSAAAAIAAAAPPDASGLVVGSLAPTVAAATAIEMHDPLDLGANEAVRFYAEVAASLQAALKREPEREDLQLKLLEVYHSTGRTQDYVNLARAFFDQHHGTRGRNWPTVRAMGTRLAPDHPLFSEARPGAERAGAVKKGAAFRRFHEVGFHQGRIYGAQRELIAQFERVRADPAFHNLLRAVLAKSARRPSPVTAMNAVSTAGARLFLKREDQRRGHDDVRVNALCQTLLARQLGKTHVVTTTRSGLHGTAVAAAAQQFGLSATIYLSESAMYRYYTDVLRMRELGASVRPVKVGDRYADPRQFALDDAWINDPMHAMYVSDLDGGPDPYPAIVREFQMLVGREAGAQLAELGAPLSAVVAGASDGYQGLGLLHAFEDDASVALHYVGPAVVPGFERERRRLRDGGRVTWVPGDPEQAIDLLERLYPERIAMTLESACTLAYASRLASGLRRDQAVLALMPSPDDAGSREFARKM